MNRKDEALQEQKIATELDPRLRPGAMAFLLIRLHRFDDAIQDAHARIEGGSEQADLHYALANAYWLKGMDKESAEESPKVFALNGQEADVNAARHAFAAGAMKGLLEWRLMQAKKWSGEHYLSPYWLAMHYARLKRKDDTLRCLEQAYHDRAPWMIFLPDEPDFNFVHPEPRYQAIVRGMKLPASN